MIQSREQYDALVDKLKEASEAYYNGKEIMSNKEFDDLMEELNKYEKEEGIVRVDSPSHVVGAQVVDFLPKFTHPYPALSLDKTKDINEFKRRFTEGILASGEEDNDGVVLMWKEDGSTVQAYYNEGNLQHLVTRGNGEIGSDITHNAAVIKGIPLTIPEEGEVVVRGEALMSYEDFEKINSELPEDQQYKNPRNLAAASIQMLDPKEVENRHIVVKAFNLVKIDEETDSFAQRLDFLRGMGFDVVEHWVGPVCCLDSAVETMSSQVENYPYPVDGLVAAMNNYKYASKLQGTEHHPHIMNGYAFKWSDETAETILRKIEWSPSRTGLLNPVAIFDPVELEGTTVQRASIHNVSEMYRILGPHPFVGERIDVTKSNKIIPMIVKGYWEDD